MTTWQRAEHERVAHGFSDGAWMRSLCGDLRWTVALVDAPDYRRCTACVVLDAGTEVTPLRDPRAGQIAAQARRTAIAEATAKRRWRRTT